MTPIPPGPTTPPPAGAGGAAAPGRRLTDWEAIERDYRAGLLSVREIGTLHGVSHTAINKRAKVEGWTRDLQAKIQAKAEAEVSKRQVSKQVSKAERATERQIVEANAEAIVRVRMGHRTHIGRATDLAMRMLAELEQQTGRPEVLEEVEQLLARHKDAAELPAAARAKLQDSLQRALGLSGRASTMRSLAESLRVLIGLEREAWGIKADVPEPPTGLAAVSTADLIALRAALKGGAA